MTDACRVFGVHRSTYYRWVRSVQAHGSMLRPRERRPPRMPNQIPQVICRILAFSIAHPGFGPDRISSELRRDRWGAIIVSPNGVWRVLCRPGSTAKPPGTRLSPGTPPPTSPRDLPPEPHINVERPGELVGVDCFYVGRLRNAAHPVWQITAIDCYCSYAWAELVWCPTGSRPARTPAASPGASRVNSPRVTGGWSGCSATTAASSKARSTRPSTDSGSPTRGSIPDARKPTAT